jgi:hypothetical protein
MADDRRMRGADGDGASSAEEPLFPPPRDTGPVSAVRGTLLLIDWRWLREHGLFDAYAKALGTSRALLAVEASQWVPFPLAQAHWEALDGLALPREQQVALGVHMGEHAHNVVLATLVRLAGRLGMSPWLALTQCHKLWMRSWQGGGMAAYRTGERSARVDVIEASVVRTAAFRVGVTGTVVAGIAPFCRNPVVIEEPDARTRMSISLRVTWDPP